MFPLGEVLELRKQLLKLLERNEVAEIIYMRADEKLTQRGLKVISISEETFNAWCFLRKEKRTFRIDRVLAIRRIVKRERGII